MQIKIVCLFILVKLVLIIYNLKQIEIHVADSK